MLSFCKVTIIIFPIQDYLIKYLWYFAVNVFGIGEILICSGSSCIITVLSKDYSISMITSSGWLKNLGAGVLSRASPLLTIIFTPLSSSYNPLTYLGNKF